MGIRFSFRGLTEAGLDLGRVVENSPRLRRFREHIEARLTDLPAAQRRQRAQEFVELFLSASLHDFGGHYVDTLTTHLREIMRIRDSIRTHYDALRHLGSGPGGSPARAAEELPRLFNDLETHMRALDGTTPSAHLTNTGGHVPTPSANRVSAPPSPPVRPAATAPGAPPALRRRRGRTPYLPLSQRRDVRSNFHFAEHFENGRWVKEARGELGVPGSVLTHRDRAAQRSVSSRMGDDAGHLIGNRFGAPGDARNLSLQNWRANQYGTFKGLENHWAALLLDGHRVEVVVRDFTRPGERRPYLRRAEWTETAPNGTRTTYRIDFVNFGTARSRAAQGTP